MTAFKGFDLVTRVAGRPARRPPLRRTAAFWLVAGVLFLMFFAAAAPSPLYRVYAEQGLCGLAGVVMAEHRVVPATGVLRHGRAAERTLMTS